MNSRAFLLEATSLNVEKAARFGRVVRLFEKGRRPPSVMSTDFGQAVLDRLEDHGFDETRDYVIITGKLLPMVGMAAAIVGRYGKVNTLCFDAHDEVRDYVIVTMGRCHYASNS